MLADFVTAFAQDGSELAQILGSGGGEEREADGEAHCAWDQAKSEVWQLEGV